MKMIEQLEKLNKDKSPLTSESINGEWTLRWTTSDSVLGTKRMRGFRVAQDRPILQVEEERRRRVERTGQDRGRETRGRGGKELADEAGR